MPGESRVTGKHRAAQAGSPVTAAADTLRDLRAIGNRLWQLDRHGPAPRSRRTRNNPEPSLASS
jgi:hypothetical protein